MKTALLRRLSFFIQLFIASALLLTVSNGVIIAQCLTNPVGPGTIPANAAPQTIGITATPASVSNSVVWSNGATGSSFTYTPNCNSPGNKTFTPCLLAGTSFPQQNFNVPNFSGSAPASFSFSVSGLCYGPGATYSGALPISIGGAGNVNITLTLPDGSVLVPPPLPISTINGLSPVDISLFGLQGDPNGTWTISIGGDATSYNLGPAVFQINAFTLTETVCGPPVQFTVTPCPAPCPVFQTVLAPAQVCSGANTQLSVQFNVPNAFNVAYEWTGPNGFTSNAPKPIVNPVNTSCDPISVTYFVSAWCTNDNTVLAVNEPVTFTVYPQIDPSQIVVDNTSNILAPGCAVSVNVPCNFLVNGSPMSFNQTFTAGDNGSIAQFTISNGNPACDYNLSVPVTCIGSCTAPTVTVTTTCLTNNTGFRINLTVSNLGDSNQLIAQPSQGSSVTINNPGSFVLGPFPNNESVNVKLLNLLNPSCNTNLGNFTRGCVPCPTLVAVTSNYQSSSSACEGDIITLNANVVGGVAGVDYYVQWKLNGEDISGGIGNTYEYILTAPGCEANPNLFTAVLVCLTNGQAPTLAQLSLPTINVYPILQFNVDFFRSPDDCVVLPVASPECAGNVVFTATPSANLTPGSASVQVNYTAKVIGAPNSCRTQGRYTVSCPNCNDDAGDATPAFQSLCWGESFSIENSGSLATSPGYQIKWNVANAANGQVVATYGPFGNPGNFSPNTFINNGSFLPAGQTYCFTPFTIFDGTDINPAVPGIQNSITVGESNIPLTTLAATIACGAPNCTCILGIPLFTDIDCYTITPGIYSASYTFSGIPYCDGVSAYNITISVDDNTTGLFNPFSQGNISSDFPAPLNQQNDDGTWTLFNYTGNPNGKSVNITAVYLNPIPDLVNPAQLSWSVSISYFNNPVYPVVCNSCHDVGDPACVELLPQIQLTPIPTQQSICAGEEVNLTLLTPDSNLPGTYTWYNGNPATTGTPIDNPGAVVPTNGQTFYALFKGINNETCEASQSVTFVVTPLPVLNTPPPLPPVCLGETIDLTTLNAAIPTTAGTLQWYIGNPDEDGAPLETPNNVVPIGSEKYYALFTDAATGCTNQLFVQAVFNPQPILLSVIPEICPGEQVDLALLQPGLIADPGVFHWFDNNNNELLPNASGQILVNPVNGSTYAVSFTSISTGCSNSSEVTYVVNNPPALTTPTPTPVCVGTEVDLTLLENQITGNTAGTLTWYLGNPQSGGILLDGATAATNPATQTPATTDVYYVVFTDDANGCTNTLSFTYPFAATPALNNPLPTPNFVCGNGAPVSLIALQPQITTTPTTFEWYKGDPSAGGILLDGDGIPITNDNPASQPIPNGTSVTYFAILTSNTTGCSDTISIVYTAYTPLSGATATYDCNLGIVVNLSGVSGGSGAGYAVAANSPYQAGDFVDYQDVWTVIVSDNAGCTQTLSGTSQCPTCNAGAANALANNRVCCGQSIHITNTTVALDLPQDYVIGWAITPQSTGPVTDADGVFAADANGLVFQGNEDYSLDFEYSCVGLASDLPAGVYYATPFISERPPEIGPPDPIIYNPGANCDPVGEICPVISGTGWVINPMIITFPDGSTLNVNQELAFGAPIDESLLSVIGGVLPCLNLASLYQGDPNGVWSIDVTNTGTGNLSFSVPDFNVTVSADSCTLITQDQISFVAGVNGLIPAGQTVGIDIQVPSPQVVIPTLTYDPANGCIPTGEFCPQITGTGWAIDELVITFPDGSQLNINDAAGGLTITEALLGALGGNLPCLGLDSLYQGDPNGIWSFYIHNSGTGTIFFSVPDFDVTTDAATCTLISQDEVVTIEGVSGAVPPNTALTLELQIPPIPSLFPAISEICNDYGAPVEIVLLDEIEYQSVSAVCVNSNTNLYSVSVSGLSGGAPGLVSGATYVFPASATFNAVSNTYTFQTTINAFPYTFQIANSVASAGGGNCAVNATIALDPCICIPPVAGFATQCLDENSFTVIVNLAQLGSSATYSISDNFGTATQSGISTTGAYTYGNYANGSQVTITLNAIDDALCNLSSGAISSVCTPCTAGAGFLPNNFVCCNDTAHITPQGYYVEEGNIIAWAVAVAPVTGPEDLAFASSIVPGTGNDFGLDFTNANCLLPAGFYYCTPFIAQTPGEAPQPDPIVYNPPLGCNPVGEICPVISGSNWVINPLIISFPDGSSINVAQQLIGSNVPITPDLLATIGGNLPCIPLSTLYNGNPNGTWTISVNNVGTGAVSFSLPAFNVTVNAAGCPLLTQDQVTTIGAVSGTVQGGSNGVITLQIPNPNTEIPDFPTFDPACQDFGETITVAVVAPIAFNLTAACNDGNGDGDFDQILVTVNSITGGAPQVSPEAQYVLPTGFTQISSGVWQASLPLDLGQTNYSVSVGSSLPGQVDACETTQSLTLPFCPVGCINPTVLFGAFCDNANEGQFLVSVNITDFGFGNSSYTISNSANANTTTATATGIYQIGPFVSGTPVTISIAGVDRPECVVSSTALEAGPCVGCSAGIAMPLGDSNVVCCGQSLDVSSGDVNLDDGTIVAWALGNTPITDPTQIDQALDIVPGDENNGYTFSNDCDLDPGVYYLTPFIAQTPGEAPQPDPVVYNPAIGCEPQGAICPIITGSGWAINPILITFPDGSTVNVVQQFLGVNLTITPELLAGLGGLPCIPLDTLYQGNPNGNWTISVNNVGTGAVEFALPAFNFTVSAADCPLITEDQVTTVGAVSGIIQGGTIGTISIQVPNPNTEIPDFPTFNANCQNFGTAVEIVVAEPISFDLSVSCYDPDGDGVSQGYLSSISNLAGGSPAIVPGVNYVLPAAYTQSSPGVYTAILPSNSSGNVSVTVSSSDGGCSATQTQALPACFFQCQPPTIGFLTACDPTSNNFYVNVNIVNFGAGNASYIISNSADATEFTVTSTGITQIGPFAGGTEVTVFVSGTSDAACSVSSNLLTLECAPCTVGETNGTGSYILCCGDNANLSLSGSSVSEGHIVAWALNDSPVSNATQAEGALEVYPANADGSYTFNYNCNIDPGVYYMTPFIAEDPGTIVQPDPIVFDPALGCLPAGEICPVITGTGWEINPLLITFPDGSTINVIQQFLGFNVPITPALLATIGGLPCIPLSTLYSGDPNGTWTISVNNVGTGAVSFEIPEFNITVSADGCPLITEDQITTMGAVSGTVAGGTTGTIDIVIPNPAEIVIEQPLPDPIVFDPALGCLPAGEICPVITGTGWEINPLLISFPDGSTINVIQQFLGFNVPITPALLATIGGLPCIPLSTLYSGDPNGEWIISVNNVGTGAVSFEIPEFNVTVSAAGCPLITEDQVTTIGAVSGTVNGGSTGNLSILIPNPLPPVESNFPTIDPDCEDYGNAVEVVLVSNITFDLSLSCRDIDGNGIDDDYLATISNIAGGAPDVLSGADYVLPAGFTETTPGVYTQSLPLSSSGTFSATVGSTEGDCSTTKTAGFVACVENCIPPTASFVSSCVSGDADNFYVTVNITGFGLGNSAYTVSNSLNALTQTVTSATALQVGPFANGATVVVTLTGNTDSSCTLSSNPLTASCADCFAGSAFVTGSVSGNLLCCNETLHVDLSSAVLNDGYVIGWALSSSPVNNAAGVQNASATFAANADNSVDLTNDCTLTPGTYYLTPFTADAANFPTVSVECEYYGTPIQVVLVDEITFDFSITCNDPDGNGVSNGYLATISNLSGGAPALLPTANYVLPTGYTLASTGVYTQVLPGTTSGNQTVQVGSSVPGLGGNCAASVTTALPAACNFTCTQPSATFTAVCLNDNSFEVVVDISTLGSGLSYTLTDNQGTTAITITETGTYNFGTYANNASVIVTLTDNNDSVCSLVSNTLTENCAPVTCTPPTVSFSTNCVDDNNFEATVSITAGSGASYTIADDQGTATELVLTSGTFSFGTYANNTPVVITVTDNEDATCFAVSNPLSADCTPVCTPPIVTFATNCIDEGSFEVAVTITAGLGASYSITDNQGTAPELVLASGTYSFGTYANNTAVIITVTDNGDATCTVVSNELSTDCTLACVAPTVTYVIDCVNTNLFALEITLTGGSGSNYTITDDQGTAPQTVSSPGTYFYGSYPSNTDVVATITQTDNAACFTTSGTITGDCSEGCTPPSVDFSVACVNLNSFEVLINLMELGSSATYTISDNLGSVSSITVNSSGMYSFGPYANGVQVVVTLESDDNNNCNVSSGTLSIDCTNEQLPPNIPNDIIITVPAGGQGVTFNVFDYVTDPNGDPMTLVDMEIPVTGGTLTFNPDGTVTFTPDPGFVGQIVIDFTVTDGNFTVSGTLIIDVTTGLPGVSQQLFAITSIVPVPAKEWVKIDFTTAKGGDISLEMYDVTGRLVATQSLSSVAGGNSTLLNIGSYTAGIYFVSLNNGQHLITGKLVKN